MQQHSKAYLHIMEKRKRRRLRKRIIMAAVAAGAIAAGIYGFGEAQAATPEPESQNVASEPLTVPTERLDVEAEAEPQETESPESGAQAWIWDEEEAYLLAKIAMAEAEGEDTVGKALVMLTVLNRVASDNFPDTVEEVIFQENAFTPTRNGRFEKAEPNLDCYMALYQVYVEQWDESQGALYFERTTDRSTWHSQNLEKLFVHGNHTFYTEVAAE